MEKKDAGPSFREVEPPLWASSLVMLMVLTSFVSTFYLTPMAFVDSAPPSKIGGFAGAVEVLDNGGSPVYITGAIPFFLLMIFAEFAVSIASSLPCVGGQYSIPDTWSSITAGVVQQLANALIKVPLKLGILPYSYIYHTYSVPNGWNVDYKDPWVWVACFVAVDFCYYWLHRKAHEYQFLWAGHSVHHSSEHFNLSTALRQSWLQTIVSPIFYLPMALFFHPALYSAIDQANVVYQFWVHTCLVRRLGPIEWIFMTPSHHRVHHDRRVHKNFGGMFIIWDRMFGSFLDEMDGLRQLEPKSTNPSAPQEEVMLFGIMPVVNSWTEVVTQTQLWGPMVRAVKNRAGLIGILRSAYVGPGFTTTGAPRTLKPPAKEATGSFARIRKTTPTTPLCQYYVFLQFLVVVIVGFAVLVAKEAPLVLRGSVGFALMMGLYSQGLLLDARGSEGKNFETMRCAVLSGLLSLLLMAPASSFPQPLSTALEMDIVRTVGKGMAAISAASLALIVAAPRHFLPIEEEKSRSEKSQSDCVCG